MKTVKEIMVEYLKANGYDGLYDDDCGCDVYDLFPCGFDMGKCIPGHLVRCDCYPHDPDHRHIGPKESEM